MMEGIKELIIRLNTTDECSDIEAKRASDIGKSIMETVCSFSNEPDLGGGYLVLGVEKESSITNLFPEYIVTGIPNDQMDKIQSDISSQAADMFNRSVRPRITTEIVNNKNVIVVFVAELPPEQKPLFFKSKGLPRGAYRRIGSSDQQCTEDDLALFYQNIDSLDQSVIKDAKIGDLSDTSIELYRKFREKVNPSAEELTYTDNELLESISAIKRKNNYYEVTYTGLLTFGTRVALRRLLPMVRVDYIRMPTNEWIGDTSQRFTTTLDMRGSLLELVQRIISTINDDLPKGFELTDNSVQAKSKGLPYRVIREAVVNALIHRSYRENSPIQIVRYPNRIEIMNPGFSLKNTDQLGEPGSVNRNPYIASIFHDINFAETKGSGIRFMHRLMKDAGMMPPTFESDRQNNKFTIRLLLHHLLNENDIQWLEKFKEFGLDDNQKRILIFVREVGAVDNASARQINGYESTIANYDLRKLTNIGLLSTKGKNRSAYYLPSTEFKQKYIDVPVLELIEDLDEQLLSLPTNLLLLSTKLSAPVKSTSAPVEATSTPVKSTSAPVKTTSTPVETVRASLRTFSNLTSEELESLSKVIEEIESLPKRVDDEDVINRLIIRLCSIDSFKINELSIIFGKTDKYLRKKYLNPLLKSGKLSYLYPDMLNHPSQAYKSDIKSI